MSQALIRELIAKIAALAPHRHKFKVQKRGTILVRSKYPWESTWTEDTRIARIDRCDCGARRGWLIGLTWLEPANSSYLEKYMEED